MGELLDTLRRNEAQTFIRNARVVCAWADSAERIDAASEQVHRAMYRAALGQITEDERTQILAILAPCCPKLFATLFPPPPNSITASVDNPLEENHSADECSKSPS